ncbi:hypothetical protein HK405_016057, partial [Cladochytrium tenue]
MHLFPAFPISVQFPFELLVRGDLPPSLPTPSADTSSASDPNLAVQREINKHFGADIPHRAADSNPAALASLASLASLAASAAPPPVAPAATGAGELQQPPQQPTSSSSVFAFARRLGNFSNSFFASPSRPARQPSTPPAFAAYELEATLTFTSSTVAGLVVLQTGLSFVPVVHTYPRSWLATDATVSHRGTATNGYAYEVHSSPFLVRSDVSPPHPLSSASSSAASSTASSSRTLVQSEFGFHIALKSPSPPTRLFKVQRADVSLLMRLRHRDAPTGLQEHQHLRPTPQQQAPHLTTPFARAAAGPLTVEFAPNSAAFPFASSHAFLLRPRFDPWMADAVQPSSPPARGFPWSLEHAIEVVVVYKDQVALLPQRLSLWFPVKVVSPTCSICSVETRQRSEELPIPPGMPGYSESAVAAWKLK